jgi:hypothetical protein
VEPVASWSWFWVFSPLLAGFAIILLIGLLAVPSIGLFSLVDRISAGRKFRLKAED